MLRTTLLSLAVCASAAPAFADGGQFQPVNDRPFLDLIGEIEGPDGYDDVAKGVPFQPPRPLTEMTIEEVLAYQRKLQVEGAASTAMGRFQFIRKTLAYMVDKHGLDQEQLFNKRTQDHLARIMMNRCKFYEENVSAQKVGNCLARAWAALPMLSGDKAGRSYYGGVGTNKAHASKAEVLAVLRQRFEDQEDAPVRVASNEPLPVIRNPGAERFADPIPLEP